MGRVPAGSREGVLGTVLVLDDSLHIRHVSGAFCQTFDVASGEIVDIYIEEIFSPRDRKGTITFHNKVNQYKSGFIDVVITLVLGSREYLARLRMTKRENGWIAVIEDILAEADDLFRQFHLGKERWTSIVRNVSEGIAMLDADACIVEFNSRFLELMQFRSNHGVQLNEDAVYDRNIIELLDARTGAELKENFEEAKTRKGTRYTSETIREQKYLSIEMTPINLPVRGFVGCSLIVKDISDRKQVEKLITDLDAYAQTVAHDLRNPLSVVMGCVDYVQQMNANDLTESVSEKLAVIKKSSEKMISIINELLLLASVRKQQGVTYEAMNMGEIVDGALERLAERIRDANAQLDVPETWPVSVGYAPWVEEIWINYISNALKYGGKNPVVTIGYSKMEDVMQYWVQDNGAGLDTDEQSLIFSEFTRLDRDKNIDGYGLGLSIVQNIIDKMGGEVGVVSEPGKGSRFYFTLAVPQ